MDLKQMIDPSSNIDNAYYRGAALLILQNEGEYISGEE
jgi:hypothetical protein